MVHPRWTQRLYAHVFSAMNSKTLQTVWKQQPRLIIARGNRGSTSARKITEATAKTPDSPETLQRDKRDQVMKLENLPTIRGSEGMKVSEY